MYGWGGCRETGSRAEAEGPAAPGGRTDHRSCLQSPQGQGAPRGAEATGGQGGAASVGGATWPRLPWASCSVVQARPALAPGSHRSTGTSDTRLPGRQQGQSPAPVGLEPVPGSDRRHLTWRICSLLMHPRCAHRSWEGPSDGAEVTRLGNDRGRPGPGLAGTLLQAGRRAPEVWGQGQAWVSSANRLNLYSVSLAALPDPPASLGPGQKSPGDLHV